MLVENPAHVYVKVHYAAPRVFSLSYKDASACIKAKKVKVITSIG